MTTTRRQWNAFPVTLFAGDLSACKQLKDAGGSFTDLLRLQARLSQKLGHAGIELTIVNGNLLRIQVVNSSLSQLPARERQLKSSEIAKFAYDAFESRSLLSNILVIFTTKRSYLFLIHTEVVDSSILYPVKALAQNQSG